jgi:micrococcal nuclease
MARLYIPRKLNSWGAVLLFVISLAIYAYQQGLFDSAGRGMMAANPGLYQVTQFVDGDTIAIDMNGKTERIRMIGVDTPETHKPNTPVQCYGPAAAAFTKNVIGSNKVRLEADGQSSNRDRYQRLLRYVYLPDNTFVNEKIIREGYGFYYPYFPFSKSLVFEQAQTQAQQSRKGLWGNCSPIRNERGGYESNAII